MSISLNGVDILKVPKRLLAFDIFDIFCQRNILLILIKLNKMFYIGSKTLKLNCDFKVAG